MTRFAIALLALAAVSTGASAQGQPDVCTRPDSVAIRGNARISEASVRADAGLAPGDTINYRSVQTAIKTLFGTGQFSDVRITCEPDAAASRTVLIIHVTERPILGDVTVMGTNALSDRSVRERVDILIGRPIDPAQVATIIQRIDSLYESEGYYLARVRAETTVVNNVYKLVFNVDEGRRLAISGVEVAGNSRVSDGDVVDAMKTRPEGFWWFRRGEFDEDKYAADLGEHIPKLYMSRGYVDFQLLHDTLLIDRSRGKALVRLEIEEGKRYRVGTFEIVGNRRFSTDEIKRFFPFTSRDPSITERVRGLIGGGNGDRQYFDQNEWEEATNRLRTAYSNEGYISAAVRPIVERVEADSVPVVNLRWDIEERTPSTINRIDIVGNDYTTEACIRDQLVILPGDVFNQDRLVRSWQSLANLGFFETPINPPDVRPANEKGDVDIIFRVKEKKTGNVNFGASVGQGTGIGGFLGLDQPNLLGQCKRVSLQWQFGRYINDFNLSFTDPSIRQSRISGVASAYHTRSRFIVADLGRSTRTGGSLQLGFPLPRTRFTRLFVSYGGEAVEYSGGLFARDTSALRCNNCFRSTLGLTETRDTRIDLPFATAGMLQTVGAQFNGGPLGGTANFQRYTTELRAYAPLGQIGGTKPGSQPTKFVLGLTTRAGAVFGDAGPFFVSQKFALGGTQFGEMLRGYEEFSISPQGFVFGTSTTQARRESFGNAFFTTTAEVGLRLNQQFYANVFFDAGNIWSRPREFDPTRLFRGAGVGIALITPLGPLGLDYGYGFDRLDSFGRPDPKWQLHFRLGNLF